jgi:iron complex outermembrane receptor protein
MRALLGLLASCAAAAVCAASPALAQIDPDESTLESTEARPSNESSDESNEDEPPEAVDVTVHDRRPEPSRGGSDVRVSVGEFEHVPRQRASQILTMAPGFFLTSEAGTGHAERIYLRGFDAREGQDLELWVGGMPVNEAGHFHGNGYADTSFIIPEFVRSVRVLEGPFDPSQGNFAVAGSAEYELGLAERGITLLGSYGTENTARMFFAWGPPGMGEATFAGGELATTDGFGSNRGARRASAMAQIEVPFGRDGSVRILTTAYGSDYESAGVLREDDLAAGRVGFHDTYDPRQGGDTNRFGISGDLRTRSGNFLLAQRAFLFRSAMGLRENLTGFLLDTQEAIQRPHGQRGDLFDLENQTVAFGAKGSARYEGEILGQTQAIELGYYARGDAVASKQVRLEAASGAPYRVDADFDSTLGDLGLFADVQVKPLEWLTLRGGLRGDLFLFDVRDNCAIKDVSSPDPANPPGDVSCFDQGRHGAHREADQRSTTSSLAFMPRGTLLVGPFGGFTFSASAGKGVRSIDPSYVTQDVETPFAEIIAWDGGVAYDHAWETVTLSANSVFFGTHVDKDQIFSETEGRTVIGGGTTRSGWSGSTRVTGDFFDLAASVTFTKSAFDDTGLLVPYVPDVVVRHDGALFHDLPFELADSPFRGRLGVGVSVIGRRALPLGQRSDAIAMIDGSVGLGWKWFELGCDVTNIPGLEYRLSEYNYVSDFHSRPAPTLVPARHFVAGAPRQVLVTAQVNFGG